MMTHGAHDGEYDNLRVLPAKLDPPDPPDSRSVCERNLRTAGSIISVSDSHGWLAFVAVGLLECRQCRSMGVRFPEPKANSHEIDPRRSFLGSTVEVAGWGRCRSSAKAEKNMIETGRKELRAAVYAATPEYQLGGCIDNRLEKL